MPNSTKPTIITYDVLEKFSAGMLTPFVFHQFAAANKERIADTHDKRRVISKYLNFQSKNN